MEDIKQIQEFFSKPLEEGKQLDNTDFSKVVKAVEQTGHPVTVLLVPKFNEIEILTGMDAPDDMIRDLSNAIDSLGYGRNDIIIAGDSSNLSRREYSDIRRVNGGAKDYFGESVNEELNLSNYGKVTPPKGGASLVGQYNSIQGKSKYDTVIFDYQEGSDKPYGIVQVEGHGIYGSDLLKRLGLRQTKSWTAGVDVYIHDGNNNPVYVSEDDFKALLDFWSGGLDREAKAQADFYRGRGNTSGTIDENLNPEVSKAVNRFIKAMAKRYDYSEQDAVYAVMSALRQEGFQGLNEMDLNDPVMMKMRAAKTKLAKMRAANAGDDGNDKFFDNAKKIAFLKKERERLMRDMEQEAEPEGGPIADEYGDKLNRTDAAIAKLSGRKEMTYDQAIAEGKGKMPTQDQVDRFFALTQNETHYLNSKPVAGQEATFNLMKVEPWDEYDLSNWNSLVRKAKQRGKSIDENDKASTIKDKIEKLRKLSNSGEIDGDEFLDKFNPLQKQLKSIDEDNSYARVSKPRFKKDKNSPNFLNVYIDYDLGPGGNSVAFGKETMSGQIRRLSSAKARKVAHDIALDLEANFDLEDIEVTDLENGKVRIFAVSDDFIDMDPNMLGKLDGVDEATEEEENEFHKDLDKLVHKTFGHSSDEKKKSMAQELAETIKLGEGVIEEELCPKGKAYIKKRKAAGEKSSAYLSGRAVKVCKGQMSGRKKKK